MAEAGGPGKLGQPARRAGSLATPAAGPQAWLQQEAGWRSCAASAWGAVRQGGLVGARAGLGHPSLPVTGASQSVYPALAPRLWLAGMLARCGCPSPLAAKAPKHPTYSCTAACPAQASHSAAAAEPDAVELKQLKPHGL